MNVDVTSPPTVEPIRIDDARQHLRVDLTEEDGLIDAAIRAARSRAENFLRRSIMTQTVKLTCSGFYGPNMALLRGPVQSITQVQYKDPTDGSLTTWDSANYQLVRSVQPERIAPAYGLTWPVTRADYDAVEITYVTGYGDDPVDVPGDILAAIKLLIGHFFENREDEITGTIVSKVTLSADRLLMPYVQTV